MQGQLPPLMVLSHGGPTSSADVTLSLEIQYLTSRGRTRGKGEGGVDFVNSLVFTVSNRL